MRGGSAALRVCALVVMAVATSCYAPAESPLPTPSAQGGGTLRIGFVGNEDAFRHEIFADPSLSTFGLFMRCCLARTLLTYPGRSTADGGTVLLPDLATRLPEVSRDGLTWTFDIHQGIKYARPNDNIEVTSADFLTAVERSIRVNNEVLPPFSIVAGAQEFSEGTAATVSGLETPDAHTLVVRLTRPFGALDYVADPSWAPIPAAVADGHDDDLGLYWPSSGPYMYEIYPADPAAPVAGFVRNPSWSAPPNNQRPANVERIEVLRAGEDIARALTRLDQAEFDFVSTRLNKDDALRYRSDPAASARVRSTAAEYLYRLPMNLAVPPFDDLSVRRAVAFALDRVASRDAIVGALDANQTLGPPSVLSQHMIADSITGGLLLGYDPFTLGDGRGNLSRARTEMSQSRYDANADGLCDAPACSAISLPTFDMAAGEAVAQSLEQIGLRLEPVLDEFGEQMSFAANQAAISVFPFGWGFELSGSEFAVLLQGGDSLASEDGFVANTSLVGARSEDLQQWGYTVTAVPSVDDLIDRCNQEVGNRRARCWADLDQVVAESITPWAPIFGFESVWISSTRVQQYTLDQANFQQFPALDKVSLVPE